MISGGKSPTEQTTAKAENCQSKSPPEQNQHKYMCMAGANHHFAPDIIKFNK